MMGVQGLPPFREGAGVVLGDVALCHETQVAAEGDLAVQVGQGDQARTGEMRRWMKSARRR